MYEQLV